MTETQLTLTLALVAIALADGELTSLARLPKPWQRLKRLRKEATDDGEQQRRYETLHPPSCQGTLEVAGASEGPSAEPTDPAPQAPKPKKRRGRKKKTATS